MTPRTLIVFAAAAALAGPAAAHRAPSPTENNRYARITLLPDGARIAYTVFFGDRPGQQERRRMDTNRDGIIDDGEAGRFSAAILADIAPWIEVEVDGKRSEARWRVVDLGLGTPTTNAGPFSLDLQILAPYPDPRAAEHTVWLEDRWPVPTPGETEVRVEESPGVRVQESHLRRDGRGAVLEFRYVGAPKQKGAGGILVKLTVDAEARKAAAPREKRGSFGPLIVLGLVMAAVIAIVMVQRRRRRG